MGQYQAIFLGLSRHDVLPLGGVLVKWHLFLRAPVIFGLFFSGFISLLGGICAKPEGYDIGQVSEWHQVADATRAFPPSTIFATYPTYNHPVLVNGHRVVMGFPGHLWSHGLNYRPVEIQLVALMNSEPGWEKIAKELGADYIFWGRFEETNYPDSEKNGNKSAAWLRRVHGVVFMIFTTFQALSVHHRPEKIEYQRARIGALAACINHPPWRLIDAAGPGSKMSCLKSAFCLK